MTGSIARATVHPPILVNLDPLRDAKFGTSHFQGCAYAEDPRGAGNGHQPAYLFQLQAVPVGPGDVEDLRIHRFRVDQATLGDGIAGVTYLDTMTVVRGGHVQSCHVRISAAGNPYVWAGLEQYDTRNRQQGKAVHRIRYRPGATVKTSSKDVERIRTGLGSADVVGCDPWTIVLRRGGNTVDRYEWHQERKLYAERGDTRNARPTPARSVTVGHGSDDLYQSSLAQGTWQKPKRVVRIAGWEKIDLRLVGTDGNTSRLEARSEVLAALEKVAHPPLPPYKSDTLGKTLNPNAEPEGGVTIGGTFHLAVQFNDPKHRFLGYFPMTW